MLQGNFLWFMFQSHFEPFWIFKNKNIIFCIFYSDKNVDIAYNRQNEMQSDKKKASFGVFTKMYSLTYIKAQIN